MRHEKSRLLMQVEGFGVFVLGQMRHEKSRSLMQVEGSSQDARGELKVLECVFCVKCVTKS